jgi:hypothetical protein
MPDIETLFGVSIGFLIGLGIFIHGFRMLSRKRLIENIPTSKIRSLALGLVEIAGKVVAFEGTVMKSPFAQKDCVYYLFKVEEYRRQGKNSRWVTVKKGEYRPEFYLQDDTGKVLVDPAGAEINVPKDFEYNSGLLNDPPARVKEFLKANDISHDSFLGLNKRMRYREYLIEPTDTVYVMGTAANNPVLAHTEDEHTSKLIIQKGVNQKFFYVSDRSEKELVSSMKWQAFGGITTGAVVCVICLAYILSSIRV